MYISQDYQAAIQSFRAWSHDCCLSSQPIPGHCPGRLSCSLRLSRMEAHMNSFASREVVDALAVTAALFTVEQATSGNINAKAQSKFHPLILHEVLTTESIAAAGPGATTDRLQMRYLFDALPVGFDGQAINSASLHLLLSTSLLQANVLDRSIYGSFDENHAKLLLPMGPQARSKPVILSPTFRKLYSTVGDKLMEDGEPNLEGGFLSQYPAAHTETGGPPGPDFLFGCEVGGTIWFRNYVATDSALLAEWWAFWVDVRSGCRAGHRELRWLHGPGQVRLPFSSADSAILAIQYAARWYWPGCSSSQYNSYDHLCAPGFNSGLLYPTLCKYDNTYGWACMLLQALIQATDLIDMTAGEDLRNGVSFRTRNEGQELWRQLLLAYDEESAPPRPSLTCAMIHVILVYTWLSPRHGHRIRSRLHTIAIQQVRPKSHLALTAHSFLAGSPKLDSTQDEMMAACARYNEWYSSLAVNCADVVIKDALMDVGFYRGMLHGCLLNS